MKISNAIARLERAGQEHSRTTEKLREACAVAARLIEDAVPEGVILPRKYIVLRVTANQSYAKYLYQGGVKSEYPGCFSAEGEAVDMGGGYLYGDFSAPLTETSREVLHSFAEDISEGLLDEISVWLEAQTAKNLVEINTLEAAKKI